VSKKKRGDASLLIGLVLGLAVGAAIAIILAEVSRGDNLDAQQWLEPAKARIEGAAEAAE
jgi:gas vesicle protein